MPNTNNPYIKDERNDMIFMYKEMLSALSDGELSSEEMTSLLAFLKKQSDEAEILRRYWARLQLGKSLLQKENEAFLSDDLSLAEKLKDALKLESLDTVFHSEKTGKIVDFDNERKTREENSKTLSIFQNVAIAASVMFVVVFAWLGSNGTARNDLLAKLSSSDGMQQEQLAHQDLPKIYRQSDLIEVSDGNLAGFEMPDVNNTGNFHLAGDRIEHYLMLHAENASLNSNQGIIPFARVSQIQQSREF